MTVHRRRMGARGRRVVGGALLSAVALGLYGSIRFVFNAAGIRVFGAEYLGSLNQVLSAHSMIGGVLGAAPAALLAKYGAQHQSRGEHAEAASLFSLCVLGVAAAGLMIGFTSIAATSGSEQRVLAPYAGLFALYMVLRISFFTWDRLRSYFIVEIVSSAAFFLVFGSACLIRSNVLATVSWLVQPAVFTAGSCVAFGDSFTCRHLRRTLSYNGRIYGGYLVASLANALSSLASFHMVIVLAAALLQDRALIGYLSVLVASLTPLRLLPIALTPVLLPELSRAHAAGDRRGIERLVRSGTALLVVVTAGCVAVAMMGWVPLLALLTVPEGVMWGRVWILLLTSSVLSVSGAVFGHLLNATTYVRRHAQLTIVATAIGVLVGVPSFIYGGVIGAGLMNLSVDAVLFCGRAIMSVRGLRVPVRGLAGAVLTIAGFALCSAVFPRGAVYWSLAMLAIVLGVAWTLTRGEVRRLLRRTG